MRKEVRWLRRHEDEDVDDREDDDDIDGVDSAGSDVVGGDGAATADFTASDTV